ncbi:helix-turn-helix domain-containing protein [Dactylosporangium sp. NPDC049525]|uniref:TetR/AcrR family transcriptional regulator n=1 Tax=Dactylosporangium sp. NPDC049525 TaxID=3154730 RepID=UPI00341B0E4D
MTETAKPPLRRDARRNVERLLQAAAELFRERGLHVPLEEIAQRAGVSPGTLYNRFSGRDALIDAVMPAMLEARVHEALARAEAAQDPWDGFVLYVTLLCELQATDPALNDAVSRRFPDAEQLTAICDAQLDRARGVIGKAQQAGVLRADFTSEDLVHLFWSTSMTVRATAGIAPDAWRRGLALALDGLRAPAAHPLPVPPLTKSQVQAAMIGLGRRKDR